MISIPTGDKAPELADCLVIGAGIGGLYASYELASEWNANYGDISTSRPDGTDSGRKRIVILEKSERVGGRTFDINANDFLSQGGNIERGGLGAWRFRPSAHTRLTALIEKFGLETRPWEVKNKLYEARGVVTSDLEELKTRAFPLLEADSRTKNKTAK
ncbi:hypothetical protein HDU93_005831, partial [Gonapodya sp. JEL0774]